MTVTFTSRQLAYATTSFLIGIWAFIKVNQISGPAFEPILAACGNSEYTTPQDFAEQTGYHVYESKVGLGAFNILVCLITQFLLELRETYPAGLLTWGGVVVVALPLNVVITLAAGRSWSKGPIRYPTIFGLLFQLLGVSVAFPLLWNPSYIFSNAQLGVPVTSFRVFVASVNAIPAIILTWIVFTASTDSYLWTLCAGILGGPILALSGLVLFFDKSSTMEPTKENVERSSKLIGTVYYILTPVGAFFWWCLMNVTYQMYGLSLSSVWNDLWVNAGPSVAFMTIDTGVLYLGVILYIAYHNEIKALKALALTPVVGPGASCCFVMKELESEAAASLLAKGKKQA